MSEPAAPEVKETIHSVVHGLLATLSPKMHSKLPTSEAPPPETVNAKGDEDCAELVENTSLHFQPLISLTRDDLARLLFWLDLPFSLPLLLARVSQDINRSSQKKLCCELVLLSKTSYNYSVCVFFR